MIAVNVILGLMEIILFPLLLYYFVTGLERSIYRPKWCAVCAFVLYGAAAVVLPKAFGNDAMTAIGMTALSVAIEFVFFNRERLALLYCGCYQALILMAQLFAIFLRTQVFRSMEGRNIVLLGNCVVVTKIIMEVMLTFAAREWLCKKTASKTRKWQLAGMLLLLAATLFLVISVVIVSDVYMQLYGYALVTTMILVLILLHVEFLYLFRYMLRANELESEMKLVNQKTELSYQYYMDLEQKYAESRKIIHDMRNHMQAVEALCNAGETQEGKAYLRDMYEMLHALGESYDADIRILRIILNEKIRRAKKKGISVKVEIGEAELGHMRDIDLTAVFANLLDNAIEAAEQSEEKWIHFKMDTVREFVVVRLENATAKQSAAAKAGVVKKKGGGHMGVGLKNVRETLERYQGTLQSRQEEDRYCVILMIPDAR